MITDIEFKRFRGYERLKADLSPNAYIVGPNSAGKSTILEAVGLAERCLQRARRKAPSIRVHHRAAHWNAYALHPSTGEDEDPVRFDFGVDEALVSIGWGRQATIHIVWPDAGEGDLEGGYFYLELGDGGQPRSIAATRAAFAPVVIVPIVTPLDRSEELKDAKYVRSQAATRRASRHFRNHAFAMTQSGEWDAFKDFCSPWLPELELLDVSFHAGENRLAVFYSEPGSRVPKELAWAGDGLQIWVQLLWHLYRSGKADAVVLDEPEVYLHPDLQRRLVRLLDSFGSQVILASHSTDVISEAPDGSVLWVDRKQKTARRATSRRTLSALSDSLGSSYNLALARSMRTRLVLGCDCEDARFVRSLARQLGCENIPNEHAVTIVTLRDRSRWAGHHDLGGVLSEVLPQGVPAHLLLGSDYRREDTNRALQDSLKPSGVDCFISEIPELEGYVLDPTAIARASGAAPEAVADHVAVAMETLHDRARSAVAAQWIADGSTSDTAVVLHDAEAWFDLRFASRRLRHTVIRPTWIFAELNRWLERDGYRLVSPYAVAKLVKPTTLPLELMRVLLDLDDRARPAPW